MPSSDFAYFLPNKTESTDVSHKGAVNLCLEGSPGARLPVILTEEDALALAFSVNFIFGTNNFYSYSQVV